MLPLIIQCVSSLTAHRINVAKFSELKSYFNSILIIKREKEDYNLIRFQSLIV